MDAAGIAVLVAGVTLIALTLWWFFPRGPRREQGHGRHH